MAAGLGTRLRPLTEKTPKPLILVGGIPLLGRSISTLPDSIDELIMIVGHHADQIRAYVPSVWKKKLQFVEQTELLGTGHALTVAKPLLADRFLVINGDDLYSKSDLDRLTKTELGMLVYKLPSPIRAGRPIIAKDGTLQSIEESALTDLVNCGAYLVNQSFFNYPLVKLPKRNEYGLPQTLATMAHDFPIKIIEAKFWMPVGTHEELAAAERYFGKS